MAPTKDSGILYRTEYFDVLGDIVATLLMSQIHYWYSPAKNGGSKLRIYREGKWWIAKSVSEWGAECKLTSMQVRRGLNLLSETGLIEMDSFMLGRNPVTHLRFLAVQGRGPITEVPDLSQFLVKSPRPLVTGNTPLVMGNNPVVTDNNPLVTGNESITEEYTETTQKLLQGGDAATETQSLTYTPGENEMAVKLSTKGKAHDSGKQILAKMTTTPKKALEDFQISPSGIELLWKNTVPDYHEGVGCQKEFTKKQQGFINRLVTLWGAEDTREVMAYIIEKWVAFCKYCETNSGAYKTPLIPSVDFLYKYGAEAKNFWHARSTAKDLDIGDPPKPKKLTIIKTKVAAKLKEPVQLIAPDTPEDPDDDQMSMEALVAWKAEHMK